MLHRMAVPPISIQHPPVVVEREDSDGARVRVTTVRSA